MSKTVEKSITASKNNYIKVKKIIQLQGVYNSVTDKLQLLQIITKSVQGKNA